MTREEVQDDLKTRDLKWLESRWSVLNKAIKKISPHLAEIEAAFDFDYRITRPTFESLEQTVCDQVLELCNIVTTHDTENTMSWGELLELLNTEIERRERAIMKCPDCHFSNVSEYSCNTCNSTGKIYTMKLEPPAEELMTGLPFDINDSAGETYKEI